MHSQTKRILGALSASALLFIVALIGSGLVSFGSPTNVPSPGNIYPEASGNFDQLVVVLMENHNLADIYGPAPYMTGLADQYAFSQHWASLTNPSQPNYIGLIGGSLFGVSGDGNHPNLNHPTIVDIVVNSGHTWKAYAEGASGTGAGLNPPRGEDHFPFLSYVTIKNNASRAPNMLPGGPPEVLAALNAGTNFIWFTPTDNHNMHDNSVSSGDSWLQGWVPGLLSAMSGKKAALIIMFDEAYTNPPNIYMSFSGPATKLAYKSTASYNHYSLIKLLEDVWGGGNLGQGDVNAPSPVEFFSAGGPDFSLSASPLSVSFASGQSGTSTISLTNTGGFTGTVSLATTVLPAGLTASCAPSSISGSQTSLCTFSSSTAGGYVVTVTGTSGTLVHVATVTVTVTAAGPTARFTYSPTFPQVNATVTFDASTSSDSDPSATLQARWDWESDGTWDTLFSSTLTATHAFVTPGTYNVKLEIQDSHALSATTSHAIVVFASGNGNGGVESPPGYGPTDPSRMVAHGPIHIASNADFTAANGVRSGTGTQLDPYIISDWLIDGNSYPTTAHFLWIEKTNMWVTVENVKITNLAGTGHWDGIQIGAQWWATVSTSHVTVRHVWVDAKHAYGIEVRPGSSDVHIEANYVQLDANIDWNYGIVMMNTTHDVTVYGNYVNAYTSGTFKTIGIHLSDMYTGEATRSTGLIAERNTVVNATGGGIVAESSFGTIVRGNLVYMDYPGPKSVAPDYPRGIETEWSADRAVVTENVVHTFHWGIQVAADHGLFHSNTIYDTTYWNVATSAFCLPAVFRGVAVDLGPAVRSTDLRSVTLATTLGTPTLIDYTWTNKRLALSVTVGGSVLFDTVDTAESLNLHAAFTGTVAGVALTTFLPGNLGFSLQSSADVVFLGSGFTPDATFNLTRSNPGGTTKILSAQSTPIGALGFTIPASVPSTYSLAPGSNLDSLPPVTTCSLAGTGGTNSWYTSTVSVTLAATDDSSGVQLVHYRVDGGP